MRRRRPPAIAFMWVRCCCGTGRLPFFAGSILCPPTGRPSCSTIRQKPLTPGATAEEKRELHPAGAGPFGQKLPGSSPAFPDRLAGQRDFDKLMMVSFVFGKEWWGRIFFLEPGLTGEITEELRFLQELVRQIGPAVYNVYLLRRLRLRAGALERAVRPRVARRRGAVADRGGNAGGCAAAPVRDPLGDSAGGTGPDSGTVARRGAEAQGTDAADEIARCGFQKPIAFLGDTVERFQRETGITARFSSDLQEPDMPLAGVPGVGSHRTGGTSQRPQAQPRPQRAGPAECEKWALDTVD